jgi:L-xylulokinase
MNMSGYLMGLDNGGSLIKCAMFTLDGREAASATRRVPLQNPAPGQTERDNDEIWQSNVGAIREVLELAGAKGEDVLGVAVCGYGNGITFLDGDSVPVYPAVVSTDSRATGYVNRYAADGTLKQVYAITQQDIWPAQPVALLPWFRDNRPDVLRRSSHVQFIKDYVRYRLTGELCGEITDASGTNLFDLATRRYDERLFRLAGIEEWFSLFPKRIVGSTEMAGVVTRRAAAETGLAVGTPVAGGLFDIDACCASSGILSDDALCLVSGTWSINEYVTRDMAEGRNKYSTTLSYLPDHYLIAESSPTSASNFEWYLDNVYGSSLSDISRKEQYRHCDERVDSIRPEESDLVFVPYLYGSNSYPSDRGAFFNLSGYYNGDHMLRAVFEGIVFSSCLHVERLAWGRTPFGRARLSGGVAKSSVWAQLLSDALAIPIEIVEGSELGALGAAMCAGICCGEFDDFAAASRAMVRLSRIHAPDPGRHGVYREKFERFKRAVGALDGFHKPGE